MRIIISVPIGQAEPDAKPGIEGVALYRGFNVPN